MRIKLFFLFLFFGLNVLAQKNEHTLQIKDADTNLPIEDASVYVVKTKQTLLSNADGVVSFVAAGNTNIQITHSSYTSVVIRLSAIKSEDNAVFLKKNITKLEEIIITKQHPQKILKSLVQNSIRTLTVEARLKVYTREFFKLNGIYTSYNDGLVNFQIFGREKNFKSNVAVEQNRSYGLITEELSSDVLGYNLNNIMENYYNFKYLDPIVETASQKDYEYLIKAHSQNENYYLMTVTPNEKAKGLQDNYTIIYDRKKKLIIEMSSSLSPSSVVNVKDKTSVGSKNIYKSNFKTIYKIIDEDYFLASSREEIGFERIEKDRKSDIEVRNYFVTTKFTKEMLEVKPTDIFKEKTLYNKKNHILTNYWDISGLAPTDEEKEIISQIEYRE
ncbi:MAG: hypothetical protein ACI7YS_13475 [Flavobacterium sp.]